MTNAQLLKKYRIDNGLSQAKFARRAKLHQEGICTYETGKRVPSDQAAARIERHTGGSVKAIGWRKAASAVFASKPAPKASKKVASRAAAKKAKAKR